MQALNLVKKTLLSNKVPILQIPILIGMGSLITVNYASSFKDLKIHSENEKIEFPKKFTEEKLKNMLNHLQFHVTQEKGTERPFSGDHLEEKSPGVYNCIVCDQEIFSSKTKYNSGSGWPSFYDVVNSDRVKLIEDNSYGMKRIEVVCSGCGGHLGHLFNDGPNPTKLRYCVNSASIDFVPKKDKTNEL